MDSFETGHGGGVFRPRRPHLKSRGGCLGCKERRKKCDEAKPRCSRCLKLAQRCVYRRPAETDHAVRREEQSRKPHAWLVKKASPTLRDDAMYLVKPSASLCSHRVQAAMASYLELRGKDLDLLDRFLCQYADHLATSSGPVSRYAWRVGIPNVAFRSSPLMHSVLAVAALGVCVDIVMARKQNLAYDLHTASELLAIADTHHMLSVREMRWLMSQPGETPDLTIVLSNAVLMVPYAFLFRRSHTWFWRNANSAELPEHLPSKVSFNWIPLCRVVSSAIYGLRKECKEVVGCGVVPVHDHIPEEPLPVDTYMHDNPLIPLAEHPLHPIVCATASTALEKLAARISCLMDTVSHASASPCIAAFQALRWMSSEVLSSAPLCGDACLDGSSPGSLTALPPWLGNWLDSHAHMRSAPHKGLLPVVLAFLSRVPQSYLDLLHPVLGVVPGMPMPVADVEASSDKMTGVEKALGPQTRAAVEIFAHWLVFLMLLENDWVIGNLGMEELGRVVAGVTTNAMCCAGLKEANAEAEAEGAIALGANWWPDSMHRMAVLLVHQMGDPTD